MSSTLVRSAVLGVLGVLVLGTAAGCGAGPRARIPQSPYSPYVALGDSYTAAPFIPVQSSDGCLRSSHNYPSLLATRLHIPEVTDRSCGGARIEDLTSSRRAGLEPQVDALTSATRLVTIGIGGNDGQIAPTLYTKCLVVAARAPGGAPCQDAMRRPDGSDRLLDAMPAIQDAMASLLVEVHRRAPQAKVLVVGYPQGVPATGTCPARLPIATGDYAYFRRVMDALNGVLRTATRAAGDRWIDVWSASRGHDICSADPWINGATARPGEAAPLHPFVAEQQAVADLIVASLRAGGTT